MTDADRSGSGPSPSTKRVRWWPLVVLAIVSWGFASWLVFVWLGMRTCARLWFVVAGVSATTEALVFSVAAGTGPNSASATVAGFVSVANWVGAVLCVLIVRRRSLGPCDPADPVPWRTLSFAGPTDVAWEGLTTVLAPRGAAVISEDFHTLSITQQSRVVVVEFHIAVRPEGSDAASAFEVSRRHRWRSPFSGDGALGWKGVEQLSNELVNVIVALGPMRSLNLPTPDLASVLRTIDFRFALKGYDVLQVDEHLEALAEKLDNGELFAEDVISDDLRTSWKGYQKDEVDEFLERLAGSVRREEL